MKHSKRFLLTTISTALSLGLLSSLNLTNTNIGIDLSSRHAVAQQEVLPPEFMEAIELDGWVEYRNSTYAFYMPPGFTQVSQEELRRIYWSAPEIQVDTEAEYISRLALTSPIPNGTLIASVYENTGTYDGVSIEDFVAGVVATHQQHGTTVLTHATEVNEITGQPTGLVITTDGIKNTAGFFFKKGNKVLEVHYVSTLEYMQSAFTNMYASAVTARRL